MMIRYMIFLVVMINSSSYAIDWARANPQYKYATLNSMHSAIRTKVLDVSTADVVRRKGTEIDVIESFKREFLTVPTANERVSEERKTKRLMDVIQKAANRQDSSGFTAEAQTFREDIALEFQDKEEGLQREIDGLWGKQVAARLITVGGVVLLCIAGGLLQKQENKPLVLACGGSGALFTAGGAAYSYSLYGTKENLEIHMGQMHDAQQGWEGFFEFRIQ